jgi:NAD(P)-dependent dehydrogenase (short-subunit alcohol dehydrogenase family)
MRYPFFSDCHLSEEGVSTSLIIKHDRETYPFNTTRGAKMSTTQHYNPQDQKALVTGATSGIGRAMAFQLARDGAEVIVHGRDGARGTETVEAIIVNNAGFSVFGATVDLDLDTFDALFASNVRAAFFLVAACAPGMVARGKGSIINVSSMAGQIGLAGGAAYGATKAALSSLTRAWAAEFSPSGVRVNAIAPGPVYTEGAAPERTAGLGSTTLLKRAANAEEIAEVVGFLASPRASYITGAIVAVDGGRTAI